jgi:hypothetical protein
MWPGEGGLILLGVWVAECVHPMQRQGKAFCKVVALVIDSDRSRSEIFWSNPDARCKMQMTENVTATFVVASRSGKHLSPDVVGQIEEPMPNVRCQTAQTVDGS